MRRPPTRLLPAFRARLLLSLRAAIPFIAGLFLLLPPAAHSDALGDADLLLRAGRTAEALAKVDEYLAAKPLDMQARFLKGLILTEQKRESEAIDVFVRLTQSYPEYAEPYNNLAVLYAARGDLEGARKALETAVRVNPKYVTAQENLGDVYARLAVAAYERAAALGSASGAANAKLKLSRELVAVGTDAARANAGR
jgi:Flp pilus assembly protein TadD